MAGSCNKFIIMRFLIIAIIVVSGLVAFNSFDKDLGPMESAIDLKDQGVDKFIELTDKDEPSVVPQIDTSTLDDQEDIIPVVDDDEEITQPLERTIYGLVEKTIELSCESDSECREAYPDAWDIECDESSGLCVEYS